MKNPRFRQPLFGKERSGADIDALTQDDKRMRKRIAIFRAKACEIIGPPLASTAGAVRYDFVCSPRNNRDPERAGSREAGLLVTFSSIITEKLFPFVTVFSTGKDQES